MARRRRHEDDFIAPFGLSLKPGDVLAVAGAVDRLEA